MASYWKGYRKIRENVKEHLSNIYVPDEDDIQYNSSDSEPSSIVHPDLGGDGFSNRFSINNHRSETACGVSFGHSESINNLDTGEKLSLEKMFFDIGTDMNDDNGHISEAMLTSSDTDECSDYEMIELRDELRNWVSAFGISHSAINGLLHFMRKYHPELPKDARTLLKTVTNYEISQTAGGFYHHIGLGSSILKHLQKNRNCLSSVGSVTLQLNIDGLPLFKSSNMQLWPILGRMIEPYSGKPFVIGIFSGNHKPVSAQEYLQQLIDEINVLSESGLQVPNSDQVISVQISCVICDTPARAFAKQVKGHSGYSGCDKCKQRGVWKGKMTFPEVNAELRTDAEFDDMSDVNHHIGVSPFSNSPVGMVSQFPLDFMHLVCLGVMKRLLLIWLRGPLQYRLGRVITTFISEKLLSLRSYLPREFLRKGRSLVDVDRWKATEFRQFLLYSGPVILKQCLPMKNYQHFVLFFVSIYCLYSPFFFQEYSEYAHQLLCIFVSQFGQIYGEDQFVYNVHGLVHIVEDVRRFGPLDNYSGFVFESFLGTLKKIVRKPNLPLQQIVRRISEQEHSQEGSNVNTENNQVLKKRHQNGPITIGYEGYIQYEQLHVGQVFLSIQKGDNCILSKNKIALVRNILFGDEGSGIYLVVEWFMQKDSFFREPLNSSDIYIYKVSRLAERIEIIRLSDVTCKCVLMPYKNAFVSIPLIHSLLG